MLIVTNDEKDPALVCTQMQVEKINWMVSEPKLPLKMLVKTRYRHSAVSAIIELVKSGVYTVKFAEPQCAISPGQSAVFYTAKGEMLGGGRIK